MLFCRSRLGLLRRIATPPFLPRSLLALIFICLFASCGGGTSGTSMAHRRVIRGAFSLAGGITAGEEITMSVGQDSSTVAEDGTFGMSTLLPPGTNDLNITQGNNAVLTQFQTRSVDPSALQLNIAATADFQVQSARWSEVAINATEECREFYMNDVDLSRISPLPEDLVCEFRVNAFLNGSPLTAGTISIIPGCSGDSTATEPTNTFPIADGVGLVSISAELLNSSCVRLRVSGIPGLEATELEIR